MNVGIVGAWIAMNLILFIIVPGLDTILCLSGLNFLLLGAALFQKEKYIPKVFGLVSFLLSGLLFYLHDARLQTAANSITPWFVENRVVAEPFATRMAPPVKGLGGSNTDAIGRLREVFRRDETFSENAAIDAEEKNIAANELFSLPELPDGVVGDLARMSASTDEDEVWRDYCLQFLGSALERTDGVTDADRALARETLVEALASTNATFAGTALRALHRGDPSDPLVASNALRIARDPSYPSSSRTTALLILEDCARATPSTPSTSSTPSTLAETAAAVSADPSASSLLRQTADAVLKRLATDTPPLP